MIRKLFYASSALPQTCTIITLINTHYIYSQNILNRPHPYTEIATVISDYSIGCNSTVRNRKLQCTSLVPEYSAYKYASIGTCMYIHVHVHVRTYVYLYPFYDVRVDQRHRQVGSGLAHVTRKCARDKNHTGS